MNEQAIIYYGKKFFPHLTPHFQRLAVLAVLEQFNPKSAIRNPQS